MDDELIYIIEKQKQDFQSNVNALIEVHSKFLTKIDHTTKDIVVLEVTELQVISRYLMQTITAIMNNYNDIVKLNKLLKLGNIVLEGRLYGAASYIIDNYKSGKISKDEFKTQLDQFLRTTKPLS